jgi:hypothetical protein
MNGELFVEDIGGLWQCGPVIKLDLVTIRPDAPPPNTVLVCRLVAPREDLKRIATSILEALVGEQDFKDGNHREGHPTTVPACDEIVIARTQ